MKNIILVFAFIFISASAFAQKRNDLQGPAFKNYKPWQHKATPTLVYKNVSEKTLKSPEFKNKKIWKTSNTDLALIKITKSEKSKLMGPSYKNHKPWMKK